MWPVVGPDQLPVKVIFLALSIFTQPRVRVLIKGAASYSKGQKKKQAVSQEVKSMKLVAISSVPLQLATRRKLVKECITVSIISYITTGPL